MKKIRVIPEVILITEEEVLPSGSTEEGGASTTLLAINPSSYHHFSSTIGRNKQMAPQESTQESEGHYSRVESMMADLLLEDEEPGRNGTTSQVGVSTAPRSFLLFSANKGFAAPPAITTTAPPSTLSTSPTPPAVVDTAPNPETLALMARLCLERVLSRPDGLVRRTELGISLRDALGSAYHKGWVNHALAELERQGQGKLTPDGVFFRAFSPLLAGRLVPLPPAMSSSPPPHHHHHQLPISSSTTTEGRSSIKAGFLVIDGGYYEWLQWHVLQGRGTTHAIDVRLLVQRLEATFGVSFVKKLYIQGSETGVRGPFHKMLEAGAGFEVELHKMKESSFGRGVGVAITAQIMSSTFRAAYDSMIVITGGDCDLAPAFRAAHEENLARRRTRQRVQDVIALSGMRMSHELFPYLYRLNDGAGFILETLMATCVVPKGDLGRSGSGMGASTMPARLSPSRNLPESGELLHLQQQLQQHHQRHHNHHHDGLSSCGGHVIDSNEGMYHQIKSPVGASSSVSRPRRWCNFNQRCKYFEDVEANITHFQRFAHVCKDDLRCPFVLDYANHRMSEEGRAHFLLWKHSCPHGLDCQYFAQPDKNRRHIEFFTHKAKVLTAAAQASTATSLAAVSAPALPATLPLQQQHQYPSSSSSSTLLPSSTTSSPIKTAFPISFVNTFESDQFLLGHFTGDWDAEPPQQQQQMGVPPSSHQPQQQQVYLPPQSSSQHMLFPFRGQVQQQQLSHTATATTTTTDDEASLSSIESLTWSPQRSPATIWG